MRSEESEINSVFKDDGLVCGKRCGASDGVRLDGWGGFIPTLGRPAPSSTKDETIFKAD